jgi:hypothetical protein
MKYLLVSLTLLMACGGSLSDEQRRQMREKMDKNKILRITEVEITEAAFARGRELVETLDSLRTDSAKLDAFIRSQNGKIRFMTPDASNARLLEKQLIDAYLSDTSGSFQDNVQKLRRADGDFDSLLYTKPVTKKLPAGSEELQGVWNIWLPKKELVLAIGKNK